tara:strand:+ start:4882 stop:5373 length:492 start_codon:yes stop_codon:yes gene_type:complete
MIDLESIIIGSGLLLVFICPLIYIQLKQKLNIKKYTQVFLDTAQSHNLIISDFDIWNSGYGIGIDKKAGVLFYHFSKSGNEISQIIELGKVLSCKSITERKPLQGGANSSKITQSLTLFLKLSESNPDSLGLEFYNIKYHTGLYTELPLIEKWIKLINQSIKK